MMFNQESSKMNLLQILFCAELISNILNSHVGRNDTGYGSNTSQYQLNTGVLNLFLLNFITSLRIKFIIWNSINKDTVS